MAHSSPRSPLDMTISTRLSLSVCRIHCPATTAASVHRRFVAATVLYNAIEVQREVGMTGHTPLPVRVVAGAHDAVTAETQAPLYLG